MKRVLFIGQAPPERYTGVPFKTTGLFRWLSNVGLEYEPRKNFKLFHTQEGVLINNKKEVAITKFAALIDFFPGHAKTGGHLAPTPQQILESKPALQKLVSKFNPDIIIPVGKLSIQNVLNKEIKLEEVIGKCFIAQAYNLKRVTLIPFPHPSGASSWTYMPQNKILLATALNLLKKEIN